MRENYLGTAISILVHSCFILLLAAASFTVQNRPAKVVEIDFSIVKGQSRGYPTAKTENKINKNKLWISEGKKVSGRMVKPDLPVRRDQETVPAKEQVQQPSVPTIVTASDARGEIAVHGTPATYAGSSGSGKFLRSHEGFTGGMDGGGQRVGQGGESLTEGSNDYNYIRDSIMKNIKYPDRARRLGLEGRVLLSFIVMENGMTSAVKVINSSGHRLLDESAKEAVAGTHISKKVPFRIAVRLPITYKLQASKDGPT